MPEGESPEMGPGGAEEEISKEQRAENIEAVHIEANEINNEINKDGEWDKLNLEEKIASLAGDNEKVQEINEKKQEIANSAVEEFDTKYKKALEEIGKLIPELTPRLMQQDRNIPGLDRTTIEVIGVLGDYDNYRHGEQEGQQGIVLGSIKNKLACLSYDGTLRMIDTIRDWADKEGLKIEKRPDYYKSEEKEAA